MSETFRRIGETLTVGPGAGLPLMAGQRQLIDAAMRRERAELFLRSAAPGMDPAVVFEEAARRGGSPEDLDSVMRDVVAGAFTGVSRG